MSHFMESIQQQIEGFIKNPPAELILWGAGDCGKHCYEWLKTFGCENRVRGFVDNDSNKTGTTILDLPVYSLNWLDEELETAVIICTMYHFEIYDKIPNKFSRPIFIFEDRTVPYFQIKTLDITRDDLYDIYKDDDMTRRALDLYIVLQKYNFGGVISYKLIEKIPVFCEYWAVDELSLCKYEKVTIIDTGAFTGDSIEFFSKILGDKIIKIYAFEPDMVSFKKLKQTIKKLGLSDISKVFCDGLSDKSEKLFFSSGNGMTSSFVSSSTEGVVASTVKLDDIIQQVDGKLCIKMDIEGYELAALKGASEIIKKYKPELSICVYHKYDDIINIPRYLKTLVPEYNCILRGGPHMECYASVDRF